MATVRILATVVALCSSVLSVGLLAFFLVNSKKAKDMESETPRKGTTRVHPPLRFMNLIITALVFLILSDISHIAQTFFLEGQATNVTTDVRFYRSFQVGRSIFNLIAAEIYAIVGLQRLRLFYVFIPKRIRQLPAILEATTNFLAFASIATATSFHIHRIVNLDSTQYDTYRLAAIYTYYTWIILIFCGTSASLSYFVICTKSKLSKPTDSSTRLFRIILMSIGFNFIILFAAFAADASFINNFALSGISFVLVRVWLSGELMLHYHVRKLSRLNNSIPSSLKSSGRDGTMQI
ncbi:hypothetical protein BKA69DRAFT_1057947 [Paraphysoderma sedebokerense]|nr:hypothetical protein BKA69DRAFT_1057947 [Paraphysoderma sedebokerense]